MKNISLINQSDEIEVHLPDGRVLSGPRGAKISDFLKAIERDLPAPVMGAIVNGELRELTYPLEIEARLQPLTLADADGARIYRRSLTFLLEAAFSRLFPEAELYVDHSVISGGYYCHVRRGPDRIEVPGHLIATINCQDMLIIHTPKATLVCPAKDAEKIKQFVADVEKYHGKEYV